MRIAVNTRLLLPGRMDGMGWFCYETMKRITKSHPEHEFIFIFDRQYSPEFIFADNIRPEIVRPVTRHPVLWYLWLEWFLPRKLKKWKADLFVSPDGFLSLRSDIPSIPVIHDINFLHRPADLPLFNRLYYNYFFPRFARKASRIGTVSEYSAADISESYGISKDRIAILYNGVNEMYGPLSKSEISIKRNAISGGNPYFVFVGTLHPRKNVVNMLRGFELFRKRSEIHLKMIIVGEKMFMTGDIDRCLEEMIYRDDVIFAGRLDPADLHQTIGSAMAMCFVPYFEGFGIPMIESMKCGIPVISSNVTSLPEIGRDAVLYCDPGNPEKIAEAMLMMATGEELRKDLAEKGLERVKDFSWDKTSERFWNLIESVLDGA